MSKTRYRQGDRVLLMAPDGSYGVPCYFYDYVLEVLGAARVVYRGRLIPCQVDYLCPCVVDVAPALGAGSGDVLRSLR